MNEFELVKSWYEALVSVRSDNDELEYVFLGGEQE